MRKLLHLFGVVLAGLNVFAQDAGRQVFAVSCAPCHGTDGNGGELGPGIVTRVPTRTDEELATLFRQGLPSSGMPPIPNLTAGDTASLIQYIRTLKPRE